MPKKRIGHKGKPKHSTEQNEDFSFSKNNSENSEDEYMTVVDYETNKKYNKRQIESNWSKYEASVLDFKFANEEDELPKTDDFNYLLKTASSDCSHFEFNSEKLWKSEQNSVPASKIFSLDLDVLSKGLACLPFYEMMGLSESDLTKEDKEKFDEAARISRMEYDSVIERTAKELEESQVKNLDLEILEVKVDSHGNDDDNVKRDESLKIDNVPENSNKANLGGESCGGKKTIKKIFFNENEEDLEDWLDSVLDD